MDGRDNTRDLVEQVRSSIAAGTPLYIAGGDSKAFYGRNSEGERLDTRGHLGIIAYEPTELVITARAGTPLSVIEEVLAEHGQMLPFDPPRFGGEESPGATLGGAVAAGLAGPGRPWRGAPRDLVLGVKLLDGEGRVQSFGGQVMKNVAGYDIARLMAGAMGTLGVLLEVSLKVLPRPAADSTRILELSQSEALRTMRELAAGPAPLAGACHLRDRLYLRLSGNASGVEAWARQIGGDTGEAGFWQQLRDQQLEFFRQERPLWRLSLPPATPHQPYEHEALSDWGGAQRWLYTDREAAELRQAVAEHGGHATLFRGGDRDSEVFQPLNPVLQRFHQGLKKTFDPHKLFNPGRLYADL
jgi:glycolate oxidase FAD binding subunit